ITQLRVGRDLVGGEDALREAGLLLRLAAALANDAYVGDARERPCAAARVRLLRDGDTQRAARHGVAGGNVHEAGLLHADGEDARHLLEGEQVFTVRHVARRADDRTGMQLLQALVRGFLLLAERIFLAPGARPRQCQQVAIGTAEVAGDILANGFHLGAERQPLFIAGLYVLGILEPASRVS